jgi:hypothetical protein
LFAVVRACVGCVMVCARVGCAVVYARMGCLPLSVLVRAYVRPPSCWAPGSCPLVCVVTNTYCKNIVSFFNVSFVLTFCVWSHIFLENKRMISFHDLLCMDL